MSAKVKESCLIKVGWDNGRGFGIEVVADRPTQHSVSFHRPRVRRRSKSKVK